MCLIAGIVLFTTFGNASVERLFKWVSIFLYGTYLVFLILAVISFGDRIAPSFATPVLADGWAIRGVTYAGYNIIGAVVVLPIVRHLTSDADAIMAGLLAGPLAMLPAMAFFVCMCAFYPQIGAASLPSQFMLQAMHRPTFAVVFQLMIFAALLESGTGSVHAVNERIAYAYQRMRLTPLPNAARLGGSAALLVTSIFLAQRFGIVTLIARGYRGLSYAMLLIYVIPLMTYGVWRLWRLKSQIAPVPLVQTEAR